MNKDKIHFNTCKIDSYNKPFNFIISEREAGKTTAIWNKVYKVFDKYKKASIVIRRLITDITDTYINDIGVVINKFLPDHKQIKLDFKKGSIKDGVVNVYIGDNLFLRILALSNPMSRNKSTIVRNPAYLIFDEFICNLRCGEKYVNDEAFRFKEIYNTYARECDNHILKCYFLGNPYSLYNPYFSDFKVDTLLLKPGAFIIGKTYCVECYRITAELRQKLLKNPLYTFDDSYKRYAFDGLAVNDTNILLKPKQPDHYILKYIFKINHRFIMVYKDNKPKCKEDDFKYWIDCKQELTQTTKKIYAIDFDNMQAGSVLIDIETRLQFQRLKIAIGKRDCYFSAIEASYLMEEIFDML